MQRQAQTLTKQTAAFEPTIVQHIAEPIELATPKQHAEIVNPVPATYAHSDEQINKPLLPQRQTIKPVETQVVESAEPLTKQQPTTYTNFAYFGAGDEKLVDVPRHVSPQVREIIKLLQLQRKEVNATETNETIDKQSDFTESPVSATPRLKKAGLVRLMRSLRSARSLEMQGGRVGLQALGVGRPEALAITSVLIPFISMIVKEEIDLALRAHNVQMEKQRSDEFRNAYRSVNPA
jgi:hypothetical protein